MHGMTEIMKKTEAGVKPARLIEDGEEWLAGLIKKARAASTGVISEVACITPHRAAALLARNDGNRKVHASKVGLFAQDLAEGRWQFNGEPLIVANSGELNDGQHRCLAVIDAGVNMECVVTVGVPRNSRMTVDTGHARSVSDFLGMNGIPYQTVLGAVAAALLRIEIDGQLGSGGARGGTPGSVPSKAAVLAYAKTHLAELQRALEATPEIESRSVGGRTRLATFFVLAWRKSRDFEAVAKFVHGVAIGDGLSADSPIFRCRARLLKEREQKSLHLKSNFEILIRSWNHWRLGEKGKNIVTNGSWPALLP